MGIFCKVAKLLKLLNKFVVNIEDKHYKIQCSAIENFTVSQASRVVN